MTKTIIDCLRHGEPEGGRMYRGGGTDHALSDSGWLQMQQAVDTKNENWSTIVSSPMLRCIDFSEELAIKKGIPCEKIENLREAGYGTWEGRTPAQIIADNEEEYWQFFADPVNSRPKNSEPLDVFTQRIDQVLSDVLERYQGQHILLVSHLAVTRALIGAILDLPYASQQLIDMPFAGMVRIIKDKRGLQIVL